MPRAHELERTFRGDLARCEQSEARLALGDDEVVARSRSLQPARVVVDRHHVRGKGSEGRSRADLEHAVDLLVPQLGFPPDGAFDQPATYPARRLLNRHQAAEVLAREPGCGAHFTSARTCPHGVRVRRRGRQPQTFSRDPAPSGRRIGTAELVTTHGRPPPRPGRSASQLRRCRRAVTCV